jgi:serine protease inhibitor
VLSNTRPVTADSLVRYRRRLYSHLEQTFDEGQSVTSNATVRSVNALTARWAASVPDQSTVLTAAGVWPLLALLADGSDGSARQELTDALGAPANRAAQEARGLLAALGAMGGVETALGLWTPDTLPVDAAWLEALPTHVRGQLTGDPVQDQARLDAWAAGCTDGQIKSMPISVDKDTLLVLASALTVRTDWVEPFSPGRSEATTGPWRGRELGCLSRITRVLDQVGVAWTPEGPVTVLRVLGDHGVDVHLYLGTESATPGQVLAAAVRTLDDQHAVVPGDRLTDGTPGPGLEVEQVPSMDGEPLLWVRTVPFTVDARHDLLRHPEVFGLRTATDRSRGHFPGISSVPLAVQAAAQSMTATFGARGFRSAAVTVIAPAPAGVPQYRYRARRIRACFDRPFGFLAVHRSSQLVLNAGWVTEPDAYEAPSWGQWPPR